MSRELARLLKEEREGRNLSLSAVAERSGLSYQMVAYVERDERLPTVETLVRIAWALEIDPAGILRKALDTAARKSS